MAGTKRTLDRLAGAKSTRGRKPSAGAEGRVPFGCLLPPDVATWARREAMERRLGGERVGGRQFDLGDLISEALACLRGKSAKR